MELKRQDMGLVLQPHMVEGAFRNPVSSVPLARSTFERPTCSLSWTYLKGKTGFLEQK